MQHRKLSIHFHGICTHFRGIVPGVPHRVVLPDAMAIRSGSVTVGTDAPANYMFSPHVPLLLPGKGGSLQGQAGFVGGGFIFNGVRVQVANALDSELTYPAGAFNTHIPSLSKYLPNYRPSTEVVYGGRASAYFDVFAGEVKTRHKGHAHHTVIDIHTDGDPVLQVTPLIGFPDAETAPAWQIKVVDTDVIKVANFCRDSNEFDFLLNYLTAEGGLPRFVNAGFPLETKTSLQSVDREAMLRPGGLDAAAVAGIAAALDVVPTPDEGTSLACSDSRYP